MKIRNGFVSNSSSSSFIVVFDEDPRDNPEYLKRILYDNMDFIRPEYDHMGDSISTDVLVSGILNELRNKKQATIADLVELLKDNMVSYQEKMFLYEMNSKSPEYEKMEEELNIREFKLAMNVAKKFDAETAKGKFVFVMEFSDGDGNIGTQLEHGGTFNNLQHYIISHH